MFQARGLLRRQRTTAAELVGPFERSDRRAGPDSLQIRMAVCRAGRTPLRLLCESSTGKQQTRKMSTRAFTTPCGSGY